MLSHLSYSGSTSLCHGYQGHRHLSAASVERAQRQSRNPGILSVLQRGRQARLEHCQQQARYQHQVDGSDLQMCFFLGVQRLEPCWVLKTTSTKFLSLSLFLRFTVHGLETRKKYVFRVKSVSHAGNSHYSEESEPILVKAAISKDSTHGRAAIASEMNKSYLPPCVQGQTLAQVWCCWKRSESLTPLDAYSDTQLPESQPGKNNWAV